MNEWKTVRLGDVCEILNGYAFKSDKYVNSGIRVIRITNVQKGFIEDNSPAFYPITEKENLKDYELYENDLLISLTGNVGRVALLSKDMLPAALNQRVGCIRIKDKNILISYLFTYLNSDKFESDCIFSARGIAQKNMSTEWLKKYLIPLPPLAEQKHITAILDKTQKIIAEHKQMLQKYDTLIKSRFIEMFGDPVINEKGWDLEQLNNLGKWESGGTPSRTKSKYFTGTIPWYSAGELNSLYLQDSIEKITEEAIKESSAKLFKKGSLFVGMYDTAAFKMGIATKDCSSNQACANILPNEKANVLWLYYELLEMKEYFLRNRHGVRQKNLNLGMIKSFEIPVPPLTLQNDFAAFVQQIDKSKSAVQKSLEKTETLYKSLMQQYFG